MLQTRLSNSLFLLVFFMLAFCTTCNIAQGANVATGLVDSSSLQVNLTNQNPDSAQPGEPVELTVIVQNIGNNNLRNIAVAVEPTTGANSLYPFSQITSEPLVQNIQYLNARQDTNDAAVLKFDLLTDANAAEGVYNLNIVTTATTDNSEANVVQTESTVQITVKGKEYAFVALNQSHLDLGTESPLEFVITNTGSSPLQSLVFSWKDPQGVILPVYSDNTKYIKYLDANQSVNIDYSVMADVNANPGLYPIAIKLSYDNYESQEQSIDTTAGIFVGGSTDFDVSYSESSQGQVSLSVANVGNNLADAVKVSIPSQDNYRVDGSSSTIVGNLQKGDYTIASFNVTSAPSGTYTNGNSSGFNSLSNPLKVQIEYTDPQGNRLTVDKDVIVPSGGIGSSTPRFRNGSYRSGGNSNSTLEYGIIIVVVAGIGLFLYRRRKQGGKKVE